MIPPVHTACLGCVFSIKQGKEQVGCRLGRTDRYNDLGCLVEAYDDEENEFYVVTNRICHAKRLKPWGDDIPEKDWADKVRSEIEIKTTAVVTIPPNVSLYELDKTIEAIASQTLPFAQTFFVADGEAWKKRGEVKYIHSILARRIGSPARFTWRFSDIRVPHPVDLLFNQFRSHFYATFKAGFPIPHDFARSIDHAINDRYERVFVLTPYDNDGNGLVVHNGFHKSGWVNGNKPVVVQKPEEPEMILESVVDKASFLAKEHNAPHLVRSVSELCPLS